MIPSGYKEDKVFCQLPEDGSGDLTFTRASDGTRVNSEGYIERVPWNLLQYSEEFSNAAWTKNNLTLTANQLDPNGTNEAFKIEATSNNAYLQAGVSVISGNTYTLSVWLKCESGEVDVRIGNINAGVYDTITLTTTWIRYEITQSASASLRFPRIFYTISGDEIVCVYGAQLTEGSTAKPYIATTNRQDVPRLDYSNGCPCLLLEPQRTNYTLYSNNIHQWNNLVQGNGVVTSTSNYAISPDGTQNATRIVASATGVNYALKSVVATTSTTGSYVVSVYLKSNTANLQEVAIYGRNSTNVETVTTEWQRFEVLCSGSSSYLNIGVNQNFGGNPSIDILAWGGQIEHATYATSLIPTTSAAVTRIKDSAILNNSADLPTAYPFTLFAEVHVPSGTSAGNAISFGDSASSNSYYDVEYYSNKWVIVARPNGPVRSFETTIAPTVGKHKIAAVYTSTNMTLYVDGVNAGGKTHSEGFNSNINDLLVGQLRVPSDTGNRNSCYQAVVFNSELTDAQCIELTTL